jgi:threonine synthase
MLAGLQDLRTDIRSRWTAGATRTFDVFRRLISAWELAGGQRYQRVLDGLSERLLRWEGVDFSVTPLTRQHRLAAALGRRGPLWVKDETGNVTGSHKGRHLTATLFYLEALREIHADHGRRVLAIYSCGNAALAAAAVARAGGYELHAFVPDDLDPTVAAMLADRGAAVERIRRSATGEGDPCYLAFRRALAENAWVPFACAGNDNWSNIEGGATMGWELVLQLLDRSETIDSVVVQVGGGALARSIAQGLEEAYQLGFIGALPRIHVCQPGGGFPFVRTYLLALDEIARRCGRPFKLDYDRGARPETALRKLAAFSRTCSEQIQHLAAFVAAHFDSPAVQSVLDDIPRRRERFMWPWDGPAPHSLAHGILDDVTYDWYHLLRAVLRSGGIAAILDEDTIRSAHASAHGLTGIAVCPTGAAGLAGLIHLQASGAVDEGEATGLFFTGFDRGCTR